MAARRITSGVTSSLSPNQNASTSARPMPALAISRISEPWRRSMAWRMAGPMEATADCDGKRGSHPSRSVLPLGGRGGEERGGDHFRKRGSHPSRSALPLGGQRREERGGRRPYALKLMKPSERARVTACLREAASSLLNRFLRCHLTVSSLTSIDLAISLLE